MGRRSADESVAAAVAGPLVRGRRTNQGLLEVNPMVTLVRPPESVSALTVALLDPFLPAGIIC